MPTGQEVMQLLMARGLDPVHAAALTGHMVQESGLNPEAYNEKEGAYGLLQHRLDRLDALRKFASDRGAPTSDIGTQLDFALKEMSTTEKKAGDAFFAGKDLPSAHAALKRFIRYGDNSDAPRLGKAQELLGGGGSAMPGTPVPLAFAPPAPEPDDAQPQTSPVIAAIHQQLTDPEQEPLTAMEIHMARPIGLARVRELLAAMHRRGPAA